jgi:hypothetical protein
VPPAEQVLGAIRAAGYEGTELGPLGYLPLHRTLDAIDGLDAKAVLCDKGPRDGDVDLDGVRRATDAVRARFEPTFHPHLGTRVQTPPEIERLLAGTDVPLTLDTISRRPAATPSRTRARGASGSTTCTNRRWLRERGL